MRYRFIGYQYGIRGDRYALYNIIYPKSHPRYLSTVVLSEATHRGFSMSKPTSRKAPML